MLKLFCHFCDLYPSMIHITVMTGLFLLSDSSAFLPNHQQQYQSTKTTSNILLPTKKPNQFDQLPTLFLLAIGNDVASVCTRKSSLHLTSANACDIVAHNSNEISLLMPMDKKNGQKAR